MMGGRCHATPPAHRVADIALSATNTMPGVVVPPCAVFQFQCSPPKQAFITSDPETQKR
jgi:hypothetical protein